jgi:hypothetical protein
MTGLPAGTVAGAVAVIVMVAVPLVAASGPGTVQVSSAPAMFSGEQAAGAVAATPAGS